MKPVIKALNLSKRFDKPVPTEIFTDISLEIYPGEAVAITGKSGEGKTTLLHILGSLEKPSSGTLEILSKPISEHAVDKLRNQKFGFIFQAYNLLEDYTVLENVLLPASIARLPSKKGSSAYGRALTLLEEVGLAERAHFPAKVLSGGEKQRVTLARAFLNDPDILFADEPSGNLDHAHSVVIYNLLLEGVKKRNKTLIVVTHDPELANLCSKKYTLMDGKLA